MTAKTIILPKTETFKVEESIVPLGGGDIMVHPTFLVIKAWQGYVWLDNSLEQA